MISMRSPAPQPAFALTLTALRGNGGSTSAPADRMLKLQADLAGLAAESSYRMEIVDTSGRRMWQGSFASEQAGAMVPGQHPGMYFVRIYLPQGELVREFGLELK